MGVYHVLDAYISMTVKELKEYKCKLYDSLSRELADFERNFLIISGAVFSFTISLLNEVVNLKDAQMLYLLFICWGCLIFSIAIIMFTFLYSANSSDALNKKVNDLMLKYRLFDDNLSLKPNQELEYKKDSYELFYRYKKILRYMRYIAVSVFIIGIVFLSLFVGYNLYTK